MIVAAAFGTLVISGAWSRPAFDEGVVYATIVNRAGHDDALVGVSSPVARSAELHRSMSGMAGMPAGVMSMAELGRIVVRAHGSIELEPGSYHVMLELRRPIRGGTFPVTFRFEHAPSVTTTVHVRRP